MVNFMNISISVAHFLIDYKKLHLKGLLKKFYRIIMIQENNKWLIWILVPHKSIFEYVNKESWLTDIFSTESILLRTNTHLVLLSYYPSLIFPSTIFCSISNFSNCEASTTLPTQLLVLWTDRNRIQLSFAFNSDQAR